MKYSNPTVKHSSLMCHWFLIPLLSCWSQTDLMLLTFQLCKQQSNTECVPSFVFPTWLVFTIFIYLLPLNPFQGRSRANPGSRGLRAGHSLHPGPQPITLTFIFMADSKWTDLFFPVCLSTVVLDKRSTHLCPPWGLYLQFVWDVKRRVLCQKISIGTWGSLLLFNKSLIQIQLQTITESTHLFISSVPLLGDGSGVEPHVDW